MSNFNNSSSGKSKKRKRQYSKPFTERRALTRKIMRRKLKFELKQMRIPHVNKNLSQIIHSTSKEQLMELINN